MKSIYVTDVSDGLCMAISTISGKTVQIDCGTSESPDIASNGLKRIVRYIGSPEVFVLSHFHIDHYNGLIHLSQLQRSSVYPSLRIKEVYYPRIPDFKGKEDFVCYLLAMNLRVFGNDTGIMAYDFLKTMHKISATNFRHRALCKGNLINMDGSVFEIMWPPPAINDDKTLSVIKIALESFERAIKEDRETRELYEHVKREGLFKTYLEEKDEEGEVEQNNEIFIDSKREKRNLPEVVKYANKKLRDAANHFSLSLFEDNRLLFLGDITNFEIRQIVDDLKSKGKQNFYVFITPHHGTRWHKCLEQIGCIYAVTSNGAKLCSKMKPQFKNISERSLATWANGDIAIPIYY